jgi:glutamine amidotransferase PdxT
MKYLNLVLAIGFFLYVPFLFGVVNNQTTGRNGKIRVGVYNGSGAGEISVIETIEALKIDSGIIPSEISAADIMSGKLDDIDAIIFPGGSGSHQLNSMGDLAAEKVKKAILEQGKGVVGICAGAFLLSSTPDYPSLALADVKVIDRVHYDRGRGLIEFDLTEDGYKIFPELINKPKFIQYFDGPIMEALDSNKSFSEIGNYISDIHPKKDYPAGLTPHKIFIYNQTAGKGRVFAVGGHPESTPGMRWMLPRMIRWVTLSEQINYPEKWIVPQNYNKEILFDSNLNKFEKDNWWKLFSNFRVEKIKAMDELYAIFSRPAVRWNIGLLRDSDPEVRVHAAYLLAKSEYTAAMIDLQTALSQETDANVKNKIQQAIEMLKY